MSSGPTTAAPAGSRTRRTPSRLLNERFALSLVLGVRVSLVALLVSYTLYVTGTLPGAVAVERLPALVAQDVAHFAAATGQPPGWSWLGQLRAGDRLSLAALLLLTLVSVAAYAALLPVLLRQRDWVYLALVLLQIAVFAVAATNWMGH